MVDSNPPIPAEKGVYLYEIEAVAGLKPNGEPDRDSNRSDYLFVRCSELPAQMIGLSGNDVRYQVSYSLTSVGNIPAYQPDSKIVVFGADMEVCHSASLQSSDVTPGSHTIGVTVAWPPYDAVIFLVCPKDNHVHLDKAHRRRWALPHNQQHLPVNASVFNHVVLVGCSQVKGGLAEQFARMGAGAAVGVGKPGQTHPSETVFMEEFVRFVENGMPIKSAVKEALVSAQAIIKRLKEHYGRIDYGDDPFVDAVVRGQRANATLNYPYQQP